MPSMGSTGRAVGLTRLAMVLVGDPESAQDVVQDAFLGLSRRGNSLVGSRAQKRRFWVRLSHVADRLRPALIGGLAPWLEKNHET